MRRFHELLKSKCLQKPFSHRHSITSRPITVSQANNILDGQKKLGAIYVQLSTAFANHAAALARGDTTHKYEPALLVYNTDHVSRVVVIIALNRRHGWNLEVIGMVAMTMR